MNFSTVKQDSQSVNPAIFKAVGKPRNSRLPYTRDLPTLLHYAVAFMLQFRPLLQVASQTQD